MTNYQKTIKWLKISLIIAAIGSMIGLAGGFCFVGCDQAEHSGKIEVCDEYDKCKEVEDNSTNRQLALYNTLSIREHHYTEQILASTFGGAFLGFPTGIIFCWFLLLHMLGQVSSAVK